MRLPCRYFNAKYYTFNMFVLLVKYRKEDMYFYTMSFGQFLNNLVPLQFNSKINNTINDGWFFWHYF